MNNMENVIFLLTMSVCGATSLLVQDYVWLVGRVYMYGPCYLLPSYNKPAVGAIVPYMAISNLSLWEHDKDQGPGFHWGGRRR